MPATSRWIVGARLAGFPVSAPRGSCRRKAPDLRVHRLRHASALPECGNAHAAPRRPRSSMATSTAGLRSEAAFRPHPDRARKRVPGSRPPLPPGLRRLRHGARTLARQEARFPWREKIPGWRCADPSGVLSSSGTDCVSIVTVPDPPGSPSGKADTAPAASTPGSFCTRSRSVPERPRTCSGLL